MLYPAELQTLVVYSTEIGFDASLDLAMAVLQLLACLRTVSVARRRFTVNQFGRSNNL